MWPTLIRMEGSSVFRVRKLWLYIMFFPTVHCKDWWDVKGEIQDLPADHNPSWPFKAGPPAALRRLPMGENPKFARIDPAHTWAIAGIGKDLAASTILLCARIGIFGYGSLDKCLKRAYDIFQAYLVKAGKYSSIDDFSYKTMKCGKTFPA